MANVFMGEARRDHCPSVILDAEHGSAAVEIDVLTFVLAIRYANWM